MGNIFEPLVTMVIKLTPKWSSLKSVGSSKAASATIFVPIIGSLIIFNNYIFERLSLIPQLSNAPDSINYNISLTTRLYLLYMGLSLVGIGSFLFNMLCPPAIKNHKDQLEYISTMKEIATKPRMTIMIVDIANFFNSLVRQTGDEPQVDHDLYDSQIYSMAYQTFSVIGDRVAEDIEDVDREGVEVGGFYSYRGYLNLEKWMSVVSGPPSVYRAVAYSFYEHSDKNLIDIATLHHMSQDRYSIFTRMIVSNAYIFGFTLLLIPTVNTFASIVRIILKF